MTRALSRAPRDRQPSMTAFKNEVLACLGVVDRAATGPTPVPAPSLGVTQQMVSSSTARVERRAAGARRDRRGRGPVAVGSFAAFWLVRPQV